MRELVTFAVLVSAAAPATASPNVPLDEPVYEQLATSRALGRLPLWVEAARPLSVHRVHRLLERAGLAPTDRTLAGAWAMPLRRVRLRASATRDHERPYSTLVRPRDLAGALGVSCERGEDQPCGGGSGAVTDLDSSAGYEAWISASIGLRLQAGSDRYEPDVTLYRAYVQSELGLATLGVGRDVISVGPAGRTQLVWGRHAPPIDHVRVAITEPWRPTQALGFSGTYVIGQLRAPQTFADNLVTVARLQVDVADTVELGVTQLLQLGGSGARSLGVMEFVLEHVRRADPSASADDSSNRRFGGDVTLHLAGLHGARVYYALMFEDIRRARLIDAVRYDADHLLGVELAALGPQRRHAITVEWHQTGIRSHEHAPRTTGFTHGGFVLGAPLGPDAESFYVGSRVELANVRIAPWVELARSSSDTYQLTPFGPIDRVGAGEDEGRYRLGTRVRGMVGDDVAVETDAFVEHVDDFAFQPGESRNHVGISVSMTWYPDRFLTGLTRP